MNKGLTQEKKEQIIRLRKIREDQGYSQEQFAVFMGISVSALKKIESYERAISLNILENLYKNLNVSIDYILFGQKVIADDIWKQILNCNEEDKMIIMLKLFHYFTISKTGVFPTEDGELKNLDRILKAIKEIQSSGNDDDK